MIGAEFDEYLSTFRQSSAGRATVIVDEASELSELKKEEPLLLLL